MFRPDLIVRSRTVVAPDGVRPRAIHIHNGRIVGVLGYDATIADCPVDDAGDAAILPGLVDISGDAALDRLTTAASEGVTTVIAASPAITDVDALMAARAAVERDAPVDIGFWASASAGNSRELRALFDAGVFGFACACLWENDLRTVLPAAWHLQALVLADGAEEIQRLVPLCRQYPARIHLLGLSSPDALTALYHARAAKLPMTASTRLQYLSDEAERLPKGREQREFLWAALAHGLLHTLSAPNLPVMWEAARRRGHTLDRLAEWICSTPAKLAGLKRKGRIDVGYDADLVVFDHTRSSIQRTYLRGVSPRGELLNRSSGMSLASSKRQ